MSTQFTLRLTRADRDDLPEASDLGTILGTGAPSTVGPWLARLDVQGPADRCRETPELVAVLRGTVYGQDLDGVLALYRQYGDDFARRLEGAFALLLLDKRLGRVIGLTDRIGTYKLYALDDGKRLCLSTSPDTPDFRQREVSRAGVGSYLVNGYLSNGLTIFEGVRSLNPRALHELTPAGIRSQTYWEPRLEGAEETMSEADAQAELTGLLRRALARRLQGAGERVYLSLSGGYDSRGLLSLLTQSGREIRTFSYALPSAGTYTDAGVAVRLAAQYGTRHQELIAYRGDLLSAIRLNACWGGGAAAYCEEVDAWAEFNDLAPTDLFTGEQVFEVQPRPLRTGLEALNRIRVNRFSALDALSPHLSSGTWQALQEAWTAEYGDVQAQAERWALGYPRELGLIVTHYEPYFLLPWRERFGGREAQIHTPYLDTDILDFVGRLPPSLLSDKTILKQTLRQLDPALLSVPLARSQGYEADWRAELMRVAPASWDAWFGQASRLDELIDPTVIRHLIAGLSAPAAQEGVYTVARQTLGRLRRTPLAQQVLGAPTYKAKVPALPALILKMLTLRAALAPEPL